MIRFPTGLALALSLVAAGCDLNGDDILVEPEFDLVFGFEGGLDAWLPDGTDLDDPPVDWDVVVSDEAAASGTRAVRLRLDNLNDQGKIWIERRFDLAPDTAYQVAIDLAFGTSDVGDINTWTVLAGATGVDPTTAGDLTPRDPTGGAADGGVTWQERSYAATVTADEDGRVWVHVGVWGTWEAERTYWVDDLRVRFTRLSTQP